MTKRKAIPTAPSATPIPSRTISGAEIHANFQDHALFCKESLIVETELGCNVSMILSPGQVRLHEAILKQRQAGRPVRILYLKSRRIQATTGTAAQFFHSTAFRPGVHTVVLAHDQPSSENIFRIYQRFHEQYKPFGGLIKQPVSRALNDRIYFQYGNDAESSFIQVHTAGNMNFGRSFRLTNVHFSEFPYYANPAATLASAMSAMPKLPETCAVIEGTAKTIGDDFHKRWQAAIDPSHESEWVGIFMAWWEHLGNRMPLTRSIEWFDDSLTREERVLMGRFSLDYEQLAWRRWTIANDFNGDLQRFKREHPATPEDAFSASARNRFSIPHIEQMPIMRHPLCGELSYNDLGSGEQRLVFLPNNEGTGAVRIWRKPEGGKLYVLGADCAQGLDVNEGAGTSDPDWSVGQILDRDTGEQCAVLRARTMPGEMGRYMAKLGRYYNMAQVCGERNPAGGGVSMLEAMMTAGYPSGLMYHRSVTPDQDPQMRSDRIGWDTSGTSRPILISILDEAIRQLSIIIHDPITIQELLTFIINPAGKATAEKGCHDDCVIALALAMIAIVRMQRPLPPEAAVPPPRIGYAGQPARDDDQRGRRVNPLRGPAPRRRY